MIYSTNYLIIFIILFIILLSVINIEKFTSQTESNLLNNKSIEIILYHADWCGHCKAFKPIWNDLVNVIKTSYNYIKIKDINCTYNTNKTIFTPNKNIIYGFPTIIICIKNNKDEIISEYNYENERSVDEIIKFINKII